MRLTIRPRERADLLFWTTTSSMPQNGNGPRFNGLRQFDLTGWFPERAQSRPRPIIMGSLSVEDKGGIILRLNDEQRKMFEEEIFTLVCRAVPLVGRSWPLTLRLIKVKDEAQRQQSGTFSTKYTKDSIEILPGDGSRLTIARCDAKSAPPASPSPNALDPVLDLLAQQYVTKLHSARLNLTDAVGNPSLAPL